MTATVLLVALAGAALVGGVITVIAGLRRVPPRSRSAPLGKLSRLPRLSRGTQLLLAAGVLAGVVVFALTGWLVALVVLPVAVVGIPVLLSSPPSGAQVEKLEALEEWTRALAGVLTVGVGLEQALAATLRSTPAAIKPEVTALVARLRARVSTEQALRMFADDLEDATGDLVAANLILGARRRGQGLAAVLQSTAESVADDVKGRRTIEADRAKPRATARWVTIITLLVLVALALTGDYVAPYGTALGQLILGVLLAVYVALLVWLRNMSKGKPIARLLGKAVPA